MSSRYEPHPTDEGKFQSLFDDYGHGEGEGKSRQAINARFRRKAKKEQTVEIETESEASSVEDLTKAEAETWVDSTPEWLKVGEEPSEGGEFQVLPDPAKGFIRSIVNRKPGVTRTKSELSAWYQQQAKLLRLLFSGVVDPLVSAYGRGVMGEAGKDWRIERSADDWELFESVSHQWIEHHELQMPVNPDLLMVGCVGAYYVPPVVHIQRNRDPLKKSWFQKVKGRFVGWRAKRRLKKMGVEEFE